MKVDGLSSNEVVLDQCKTNLGVEPYSKYNVGMCDIKRGYGPGMEQHIHQAQPWGPCQFSTVL